MCLVSILRRNDAIKITPGHLFPCLHRKDGQRSVPPDHEGPRHCYLRLHWRGPGPARHLHPGPDEAATQEGGGTQVCRQQGGLPGGLRPPPLRALLPAGQGDLLGPGRAVGGAGELPQAAEVLHHLTLHPRASLWLAAAGRQAGPRQPGLHGAAVPQ